MSRSVDGREYLDASAGLWYCNVGHGRREIGDAVASADAQIAAYSNFGDLATRPTVELADRLAALAPMPDAKVFFTSGGSDAVDTAFKLVRRYWVVARPAARAPRSSTARGPTTACTWRARRWPESRPTARATDRSTSTCRRSRGTTPQALAEPDRRARGRERRSLLLRAGHRRRRRLPAAAGLSRRGARDLPGARSAVRRRRGHHRLRAHRRACSPRRVLSPTGPDRQGPHVRLPADGRGASSSGNVAEPFWNPPGLLWRHGYTYSGHASAAAAAMANLDIIEGEGLVARVAASAADTDSGPVPAAVA